MAQAAKIAVIKSEPPETTEILAEAITKISKAHIKLSESGLNSKAIVLLLCDQTKLPKRDVIKVLDALPLLVSHYCK